MDATALAALLAPAVERVDIEIETSMDHPTIAVPAARLLAACHRLRHEPALACDFLADLTAVDWWPREPRFEVVYHVVSISNRLRARLKVRVAGENPRLPTVAEVWPAAGWLEREVWDLFGIVFDGHPDLRRLLMPEDWEGYPLRKDYPVQIRMAAKTYEPLQVSEAEFRANLEADREARRS